MMAVPAETVKKLRDLTGAGMLDCKKALEETGGELERAKEILHQRGIDIAGKKATEETRQGLVEAYIHRRVPGLGPRPSDAGGSHRPPTHRAGGTTSRQRRQP